MAGALPAFDNPRVLVVEDEFLIALQLEAILTDFGCEVVGTVSDLKGLAGVVDAPDIALVDINLRDGPTGCTISHELSRRFGTTIIYVTANPDQITSPAPTAVGIVVKPFSPQALHQAIDHAGAFSRGGGLREPGAGVLTVFSGR